MYSRSKNKSNNSFVSLLFQKTCSMTDSETKNYFYAVRYGKCPGIYNSWEEREAQIKEHDGTLFKKFSTREEAETFLNDLSNLLDILAKLGLKDDNPPPTYAHKGGAVVYVDAVCLNNGNSHGRGKYGVYLGEDDNRNASEGLTGPRQTNRRAEISAVNYCLKQSQNDSGELKIVIASEYVINSVTLWSKTWIKNGWKKPNGEPVKNKDLLKVTLALKRSRKSGNVLFVNGANPIFSEDIAEAKRLALDAIQL